MFSQKTNRQLNVVGHKIGKGLFALFTVLALVLLLVIVTRGLPNNHPIAAMEQLADFVDFDGSLTFALKSSPAILISVTALLMSLANTINAMNAKPSFNIRDVAAADRFIDWGWRWVISCDESAKVAVVKADAFRWSGEYEDFRSAVERALSIADVISTHIGDGKSAGCDFRYLDARPLFNTDILNGFLTAVSATGEFAGRYRDAATTDAVHQIDRIRLLADIQSIATATAYLRKQMHLFVKGKWKDQVAH